MIVILEIAGGLAFAIGAYRAVRAFQAAFVPHQMFLDEERRVYKLHEIVTQTQWERDQAVFALADLNASYVQEGEACERQAEAFAATKAELESAKREKEWLEKQLLEVLASHDRVTTERDRAVEDRHKAYDAFRVAEIQISGTIH